MGQPVFVVKRGTMGQSIFVSHHLRKWLLCSGATVELTTMGKYLTCARIMWLLQAVTATHWFEGKSKCTGSVPNIGQDFEKCGAMGQPILIAHHVMGQWYLCAGATMEVTATSIVPCIGWDFVPSLDSNWCSLLQQWCHFFVVQGKLLRKK